MTNPKGILYLFPVSLGESDPAAILPQYNIDLIKTIDFFIAENAKEARAFLKLCGYADIQRAQFSLINKHANPDEITQYLEPLLKGQTMGLMSDAGCPGIADPGADIIALAHKRGIKVVPLVGPSSIVLSIMASGFNGQNFAFNGYLPIDKAARMKKIKELELLCVKHKQAQFFIETPYRNLNLFEDLVKNLAPATKLLVATNITLATESIKVLPVSQWKASPAPEFHKAPTVFGIY